MITNAKAIDPSMPRQDWADLLEGLARFDGVFIPDADGVDETGAIAGHLRELEVAGSDARYVVRVLVSGEEAAEEWSAPTDGYLVLRVS